MVMGIAAIISFLADESSIHPAPNTACTRMKELRKGYESAKKRKERVPAMLCLEKSRKLAAERIKQMDELLSTFEKDSLGYF